MVSILHQFNFPSTRPHNGLHFPCFIEFAPLPLHHIMVFICLRVGCSKGGLKRASRGLQGGLKGNKTWAEKNFGMRDPPAHKPKRNLKAPAWSFCHAKYLETTAWWLPSTQSKLCQFYQYLRFHNETVVPANSLAVLRKRWQIAANITPTIQNYDECHQVPRLLRKTQQRSWIPSSPSLKSHKRDSWPPEAPSPFRCLEISLRLVGGRAPYAKIFLRPCLIQTFLNLFQVTLQPLSNLFKPPSRPRQASFKPLSSPLGAALKPLLILGIRFVWWGVWRWSWIDVE